MGIQVSLPGDSTDIDNEISWDDVYHDFIAVDEQGTEAAAATAIVVGETSAPMENFGSAPTAPSSSQSATRSPALCFSSGESLHSNRPAQRIHQVIAIIYFTNAIYLNLIR